MKHTRHNRHAGFTLLEVLVATAILGTAVAALFGLLSGALSNARKLEGPEQALLLGRSKLNELLATAEEGRNASVLQLDQKAEGRWNLENGRYRWEALARRVAPEDDALPGQTILVRIDFDVFWKPREEGEERRMAFETYEVWQQPQRNTP